MADYKRECENWLVEFGRWTLPRSEAPQTYIFWTGLFTLASALRRHVKVPKKLLGSWEVSPNLYVFFVAPPGKARKTTTTDYNVELLEEIPHITKTPDLITKESLLTTLVKSDDAAMSILAGEWSEFIVKSGPDMYGLLTNLYDGKRKISVSTLSRNLEFVERPCMNLLAATTPIWIAANMPESVIGGGFASRVIFVFEETVRRRQIFYDSLDWNALDEIRTRLIADLQHISLNIHGDFQLEPEAKDFMEHWYGTTADEGTAEQYKMSGYFERRPAHVFKLAMLLHLASNDELILNKNDFELAIGYLGALEKKLPRAFQAMGKNPYTVDMDRIVEYVGEKGRVSKQELFAQFYGAATPSMLQELVDGLSTMGFLTFENEGSILYIKLSNAIRLNGKQPTLVEPVEVEEASASAEDDTQTDRQ